VTGADGDLVGGWHVARYQQTGPKLPAQPPDVAGLEFFPATVPGAVNYDVLAQGGPNPYASSAAARDSQWVAESDWVYRRAIPAVGGAYAMEFDGVDTFADVWLGGVLLGRTANAYRRYRFEIPPELRDAVDVELLVHVKGHRRMIEDKAAEARARIAVQGGHPNRLIKSLVRRYQRNSFSNSSLLNLGVHVLGIGIYKPVRLLRGERAQVTGARVTLERITGTAASIRVDVTMAGLDGVPAAGRRVELTLAERDTGRVVAAGQGAPRDGVASVPLTVEAARLWWPRGYGEAYLYRLTARLCAGDQVLHEHVADVGLRRVELRRDHDGRPAFGLRVNDVDVYVRGTNLIPVDYLKVHDAWPAYERLLRMAEAGNYNLVRLWGGGAIEDDRFFAACDRMGIMLWQDLYLHSNAYPDYDPEFVAEFRAETRELLARMRDHPSLVLICGGNEQAEGWDEWNWRLDMDEFYGRRLAHEVGAEEAGRLCADLPFIENSPHGGRWAQSPVAGDTHTWGNFFNATKDPQFVTETCWSVESYSRPETLREIMGLDLADFADRGWARRWTELTGLTAITKFPFSSYHDFDSLADYLRGLEIEQAMADEHALRMLRLRSSSCRGIVYWSFNKGGPLFQFGCVDYGGRPMMSYYVVKRAFAECAVGVYLDIDDVQVVATNATRGPVDAELRLSHVDARGTELLTRKVSARIEPARVVRLLSLPGLYQSVHDRTREAVHAELVIDGETISRDTLYFCPLSEVRAAGEVVVGAVRSVRDGQWELDVEATGLAKMVKLESAQRLLFSDNYFTLLAGRPRTIEIRRLDPDDGSAVLIAVGTLDGSSGRCVELPR
jgi:beta-mannosidase